MTLRSRGICSRMAGNSLRGTATSAVWKNVYREWSVTFAPILISLSRNVVIVQCFMVPTQTSRRGKLPIVCGSFLAPVGLADGAIEVEDQPQCGVTHPWGIEK